MNAERSYQPDWENCDNWTEYSWEEALKFHDDVAGRYFSMLDRYGDLPDADEIIAAKLGSEALGEFDDADTFSFEVDFGWDSDFDDDDDLDADAEAEDAEAEEPAVPGDLLYFETAGVFKATRQLALGWCNIMSSVLSPEDRFWGMTVLFRMGRILRYLSLGIGDGTYERLNASIAFSKRALAEVNLIIGEIDGMLKRNPRYHTVFGYIREHLLKVEETLVDFLLDCRKRRENGGLKPDH